jgi:iron complex transport system permease protein
VRSLTAPRVGATAVARRPRRPTRSFALGAAAALGLLLVVGLLLGTVALPLADTLGVLGHRLLGLPAGTWAASTETIVMELRLPRVLGAMVVGGALGISGAVLQGLLRNPLADPYVLGTASGAALGAAVGVLLPVQAVLLGFSITGALAFVGALVAVALVVRMAGASGDSRASVLLVGYAVASVLAAGLALAMYLSGADLRRIVSFLLGSFSGMTWTQVGIGLPVVVIGTLLIVRRARALDAMLLGDDAAAHLGVDVRRERRILLALSALVTAAAVAMAGLIGFVGLVVPHVVRLVTGPTARSVLPLSALVGAAFMVLADLIARIPGELPVGIVTAIVGVPVFLMLLRRARGAYEL